MLSQGSKIFHFRAVFGKEKVSTPTLGVDAPPPPEKSWVSHCSVMVKGPDCQASDLGSIPGQVSKFFDNLFIVQFV